MSEQKDDGIVPVNELFLKSNSVNSVKSPISLGIVEVNAFLEISNFLNCVKSPISLGIVELNELPSTSKYVNCVSSPISLGMVEPVVVTPISESNTNVDRHLVTFEMERKLQAIPNGVKKGVGFEVVVGLLEVGACVGNAVLIGFGVGDMGAIGVGSGVAGAVVIGAVVGGAVVGWGVEGAPVIWTVGGDVNEESLEADGCRTKSTTITATAAAKPHAHKVRPATIQRRWYHFILLTYWASATNAVPSSFPSGTRWASTAYTPIPAAAEFGTPSSCLDSSVANSFGESYEPMGDLTVLLVTVLRAERTGNAPGPTPSLLA